MSSDLKVLKALTAPNVVFKRSGRLKEFQRATGHLETGTHIPVQMVRNKVKGQLEARIIKFSHMVFLEEIVGAVADLI